MKSIITAPAETPAKLSDILGKGCTCALRLCREYNYNFPNKEVKNPADRVYIYLLLDWENASLEYYDG